MILYEFEGKELFSKAGIPVPQAQLITLNNKEEILSLRSRSDLIGSSMTIPLMLKAQVLSGKRAEVGGIVEVENQDQLEAEVKKLLGQVINKEVVEKVLVEEKVKIEQEIYLSISYDTETRGPVLTYSESGGTGVEERAAESLEINILEPEKVVDQIPESYPKELITKVVQLFFIADCLLLEINPLVKTPSGAWIALDAKIKLDDTAQSRHKDDWHYPPRSVPGYNPTEREIAAKKIDQEDYRGTAGSTYFDLDGDIAILASGGGGSLTAMDALISLGGKPANYTEYSGNPPKEKVTKLTEVVLSKPGLNAVWVVGAIANLTDIYETLTGLVEGLRILKKEKGIKLDMPIVIRRAGPRDAEAFEMLRQVKDFDLHLYGVETSIVQVAQIVKDLALQYQKKNHD